MKTALTIAGSDPSGWAGIQADLSTFEAFGVRGLSAVTSLTAQNTREVKGVLPVGRAFLRKEILVLLDEMTPDAVKIGMLATSGNAKEVAGIIKEKKLKNVVLDPVLRSTSGRPLMDRTGAAAIIKMLPFVTVVTPNLMEASALSGIEVRGIEGMESAARKLNGLGARYVLVKGGHLPGSPVDVLYNGKGFTYLEGRRLKGRPERFHGTGCVLSSAIAAGLANGGSVEASVRDARGFLMRAISSRRP